MHAGFSITRSGTCTYTIDLDKIGSKKVVLLLLLPQTQTFSDAKAVFQFVFYIAVLGILGEPPTMSFEAAVWYASRLMRLLT